LVTLSWCATDAARRSGRSLARRITSKQHAWESEAAGDVRHGSIKRCASAVGESAMAVALVHRYLANG